jgi:hypothetical protein
VASLSAGLGDGNDAHARRADADESFDEVGARDREEGRASLDRLGHVLAAGETLMRQGAALAFEGPGTAST